MPNQEILPHLFRQEYTKLTALLCRQFGLPYIEIAEDIASDTFLRASEYWSINGMPDNPTAWLYTVARNKAKDYLKRDSRFKNQLKETETEQQTWPELVIELDNQLIADSQLAMIFAVCNPANSPESQIALALQIFCGFSVEEIANAFLTKTETIKKRLLRARTNLRNDNFQIRFLRKPEVESRVDAVLKTLYLLFNEGYFSKTSHQQIRKDFCWEAMRLTVILTEHALTHTPQTNALLALMCFQSSRLEARTNSDGEAVLFEAQDKHLWDQTLIEKGNYFLVNACTNHEISTYHLEAGIAYWHTTSADGDKWRHILQLYNQLILIAYSPLTALNRTVAFAKVYGNEKAIPEARKLDLSDNSHYHALLGYLYAEVEVDTAIEHYQKAIALTPSEVERNTFTRQIERLRTR
ncbi:RNA polymerase sigma factor [Siphonobacter sp. SORGH_AS_1065]|uniref:RNA polymerase sigma factor n=1 Tax=Siphonobacter sp. SORGH_AS_1065 TaxID=3041795 RepID=UPI0027D77686|nr:sigma-70 family RNA polymerase sigma factor [Siphonobacter sp. SORGH_AS_1065]